MRPHTEKEFLEAFESHSDALFRHALYRVSDREKAYDLTQDAFMKAWEYVQGGGQVQQYKSFLYRVLHNLIVDEYRKKSSVSLDAMLDDEEKAPAIEALMSEGGLRDTEEGLDRLALVETLHGNIQKLPDGYREVITLRLVDGFSTGEIADMLKVSENVVSVRVHRGISKLRALSNV